MAFDTFLKIDGIPGESTDDKHKDWIEILSFDHQISQPASATKSSVGGAGSERVDHADFAIVKNMDKSSPKIYEYCCTGKHIKEVIVEMCRAGGDKLRYMEVKMQDVLISKVRPEGASQLDKAFPSELVTFNYGQINWTYTQQKRADGSGGGNVAAGWDLRTNKVASA